MYTIFKSYSNKESLKTLFGHIKYILHQGRSDLTTSFKKGYLRPSEAPLQLSFELNQSCYHAKKKEYKNIK